MSDYAAQRFNMVESQVRANDVTDQRIQKAMLDVPRERFVPARLRPVAYMDGPLEVARGRFLLDARSFAKLAQLAAIRPGDVVLDVGAASGYSAAVLARIAARVVALEEDAELVRIASEALRGIGNVELAQGRLAEGHKPRGPYDVIFAGGAVETRPEALLRQLKESGRLVTVVREGGRGQARLYLNTGGAISERIAFDSQAQVLPGFEKARSFVF